MSSQCYTTSRSTIILYFALFLLVQRCAAGRQRICGKALSDVLATVCVNGFNYRIKRCLEDDNEAPKTSPPDDSWYYRLKDMLRKMEFELNEDDDANIDIPVSASTGTTEKILIRKRKQVEFRLSLGVADECCTNGCVYADILMYCA